MRTGHQRFDLFTDGLPELVPGGTIVPAWSPDGTSLAFLDGTQDDRCGWLVDLVSGTKGPLFADVQALRDAIRDATGQTPPGKGLPFDHVSFVAPRVIASAVGSFQVTIDLDTGAVTKSPKPTMIDLNYTRLEAVRRQPREYVRHAPIMDPQNVPEVTSPTGDFLLSTVEGNIIVRSIADDRTASLTTDGTPEHDYRFNASDPIMEMMGLTTPVCNWSPDGSRIAVYKVDNRGVHRRPQAHFLQVEESVDRYYPRAGGQLERYTLHVADVHGRPPVQLDLGDTTDTYPVHTAWTPDGSHLVVGVVSRDCRRADVLLADAATGSTRKIFSEESETFLRVHHDVYFSQKLGLFLTPDGTGLLWLSSRSGWQHLYLYDLDGNLVRQLTEGEWPVDYVRHIDGEYVYLTGRPDQDRPYDVHLARVPLAGGPLERLSEGQGVHSMMFAPTGDVLVDTWSTPADAPRSVLRRKDGSLLCELSTADLSRLEWTPAREFTVTAADGETELWGTMFFPADFDETRQYPLIELVYGGPQTQVAPHSFTEVIGYGFCGLAANAHALAQLGHVVVMLDARGTPGRSKAFHDTVFHDWRAGIIPDHATAIEQLKQRHPFISDAKAGVIGHSWGGYTAFRLAAERPDIYAAAVSSAPGFDPYSSVLYECYLGFPQTDAEAYRSADPYPLAAQLEAEYLLVCGTTDHATWSDSVKMSEALILAGKMHEFVVLPGQYHLYGSDHDAYFWRKVTDFFRTHLKGL
ncbi:S9 family peptidase [Amycolatopsis thailandensis]|uniref:S9 family peptidase n=1 Tax=Amycolatopsis thailandensis TaxID=589330 RepID=UPI00362DCC55